MSCYNQKTRMKKKRHSEEQFIAILKEAESGLKTAELIRKHGICLRAAE